MVAEKSWMNHCCQQQSSPGWGGLLVLLPPWQRQMWEQGVRNCSWGPRWLSLGLDKVYDGRRRDHTKKDWVGKGNSGAWNTRTCLGQYFASVIKIGRVEVAPELDTSPEPNRYITALHPTVCIFEIMHVKLDSNRRKIAIYWVLTDVTFVNMQWTRLML